MQSMITIVAESIPDVATTSENEAALHALNEQFASVTEAMSSFLETGSYQIAHAFLLRCALHQTESHYGFVAIIADGKIQHVVLEGQRWDGELDHGILSDAERSHRDRAYLQFLKLDGLVEQVIARGQILLCNDAVMTGDRRPDGRPLMRHFLGVPIRRGSEVVGVIGVADRPGGYTGADQSRIQILSKAIGVLCDSYRRQERELLAQRQKQFAEEALRVSEHEQTSLREAISSMEQVLGVVGHELRTPLAGVRAMAELVLVDAEQLTEQNLEFIQRMHEEIVKMAGTVNDLLEAARLNCGRARWNWGEVNLEQVCGEAVESVWALVDARRVRLIHSVQPNELTMRGDKSAICRLIVNLLSNARKHTTDGEIEVAVEQEIAADGFKSVEIRVRDTGAGIAPEMLPMLGQAFMLSGGRVGASHVEGSGLGLAICKGIVAAHGGTFRVESAVGTGTTIFVRLRADLAEPVIARGKVDVVNA